MIGWASLMTFVGMGAVTYATRVLGFLLLRNRHLSPRARAVMQSAPGCVLISVIAPYFVSSHPEQLVRWRLPWRRRAGCRCCPPW
ncbi:AzlD family protein [Pseudomonas aegrilactucae]|uniref:AzlD family protein n=1 Tax=Pseudomonas aegrilactucae TaxID=2854028 RepID=UPI0031343948